jgi:hypothetical protein
VVVGVTSKRFLTHPGTKNEEWQASHTAMRGCDTILLSCESVPANFKSDNGTMDWPRDVGCCSCPQAITVSSFEFVVRKWIRRTAAAHWSELNRP